MPRLDQITLKQLRALTAVVEESTILAAAERLNLTGPAVHNQLKTLESIVGSPLLSRAGAERNTPTAQGRALLRAAAEIETSLDRAVRQIGALGQGLSGRVVLGVVSTGKYFAPRIVALLQREMPDVQVALRVGNREEIVEAMERAELDLCIMGRPPRTFLTEAMPLFDHPHIIIANQDHPLARDPMVPREALLRERFVMREAGSGTRILATRFLDEIGHDQVAGITEMSSNETIKQAVIHGLGIAMISAHTVADELASGRLVRLRVQGLPIYRKWYLLPQPRADKAAAVTAVERWILDHADVIEPSLDLS
ncbi:LysR family transcriptional regulator [Donghicola sp. XS_ASV15]|uniref:LysR family transcriptional regulator n=1 Tax=Donghicola sp. XS_ASV15 TaxID=3241295 RepID=UPI003512AD2C